MNRLYYGDCMSIMMDMAKDSVDLIYLDPPFNSDRDYNAIYEDETGRPLPDQIEAFNDAWRLDPERERAIRSMPILLREAGVDDDVAQFWRHWTNALRNTNPKLLAYLSYMTERLIPMKSILRPTGSLFLHCDPTASHYIKIMMDAIFGHSSFKNEIIWKRVTAHSDAKKLGAVHDVILYYSPSKRPTFNPVYGPYSEEYVKKYYKHVEPDGRRYMDDNLTAKGLSGGGYTYEYKGKESLWRVPLTSMERLDAENRLYFTRTGGIRIKKYLDEMKGAIVGDVWTDIPPINSQANERLGYATQKPVALMERIIELSTNPGDVVLDPFCGCATTIEAAHKLDRRWIGIDIAIHAIKRVAKVRLEDRLGLKEGVDFTIEGVPHTVEGAIDLWTRDKYHFQKWAIEQIDGFVTTRKTGDGGIDGRIYFSLPNQRDLASMVLEVKGGKNVGISTVRDMRGVLERDDALMSGLIVMEPLSDRKLRNFEKEMAQAGDLDVNGVKYQRMQILSVAEILDGRRFTTPSVAKGKTSIKEPMLPLGLK